MPQKFERQLGFFLITQCFGLSDPCCRAAHIYNWRISCFSEMRKGSELNIGSCFNNISGLQDGMLNKTVREQGDLEKTYQCLCMLKMVWNQEHVWTQVFFFLVWWTNPTGDCPGQTRSQQQDHLWSIQVKGGVWVELAGGSFMSILCFRDIFLLTTDKKNSGECPEQLT